MAPFLWLLGLTVRSTVILSVALLVGMSLRGTGAAARHRLLTFAAFGLLLLPALSGVLPRWEIARAPLWTTQTATTQTVTTQAVATQTAVTPGSAAPPSAVAPRAVSG